MNEIVKKIADLKLHNGMTKFQIVYFIIGDEPTNQAKMMKCVTEIKARLRSIDALNLEIRSVESEIKNEKNELKLLLLENKLVDLKQTLETSTSECNLFGEIFELINNKETYKDWNSQEVQEEYWNAKIATEILRRNALKMPVPYETIKVAMLLPDTLDVKKNLIQAITKEAKEKING